MAFDLTFTQQKHLLRAVMSLSLLPSALLLCVCVCVSECFGRRVAVLLVFCCCIMYHVQSVFMSDALCYFCFVHCDIICILTLVYTRRKQSRTLTAPFYSYFESQDQIQCPSQLALLAIVQMHSFLLQCRAEQAVLHFLCLVLLNGLVSIAPPC